MKVVKKMMHSIYRVISFKIVASYTLEIMFDDNTVQTIDFLPVLKGEIYGPLQQLDIFNMVRIDSEVHTLVWPTGADFDPETLHNWPQYVKELKARAEQWA